VQLWASLKSPEVGKTITWEQSLIPFLLQTSLSPQLIQLNTGFRKKQVPLKIDLSCKVANYKDIQEKILSFLYSKLAKI